MSRLPREAASRNISDCNAHAMSHVGCRLMVASSAKTNRPLPADANGDMAFALATKAAMSSEVEASRSGSAPSRPRAISPVDFELSRPPDMSRSRKPNVGCGTLPVNARLSAGESFSRLRSVVRDRHKGRDRTCIGHNRRLCRRIGRPKIAAILVQHLVQRLLDRRLGFV